MSATIELTAERRTDVGKGASRRLRREENKVPAIVYGGGKEPMSVTFHHKDILKALKNEAFFSQIITIQLEGKGQKLLLKDIQRHPHKARVLHLDFLRITGKETLTVNIPLHFLNEDMAPAVKQGGVISHLMKDVAVSTSPANLPEFIEVDLANLDMDQTLHLSDLKFPKDVTSVELSLGEEHDQAIVSAHKPKVIQEPEEEEADAEAAADEEGAETSEDNKGETQAPAEGE